MRYWTYMIGNTFETWKDHIKIVSLVSLLFLKNQL